MWRTAARTSRGLLAAHFRLWIVTRRAAQTERTHSISSISLGHLPKPRGDIKLSGWLLFSNEETSATYCKKAEKRSGWQHTPLINTSTWETETRGLPRFSRTAWAM